MANALVTDIPATSNIVDGIAGTSTFLVKNTARIEGMPKTTAVFRSIMPALYFGNAPTKLLKPTIKSEYAVAKTGSTLNK